MKIKLFLLTSCLILTACNPSSSNESEAIDTLPKAPLFKNSIVSTDIDFITDEDPDVFLSLGYQGQAEHEMPDRRNDLLMDDSTFVFKANFSDGNEVEIWAHSSFGSVSEAEKFAKMLAGPLGKLPQIMRQGLPHVVIHQGDETAFGESEGHFFVLYSENMETRIRNHDLEETVFHETVQAALDSTYKNSEKWLKAQKEDGIFITEYGANKPNLEDLPESAYTLLKHPGRLSADIEEWISENIPNRLAFFRAIYK